MKTTKIDGNELEVFEKEITSCNVIKVSVGTTGIKGGDSGHGGRTLLVLEDLGCTDMRCKVSGYEKTFGCKKTESEYEEAERIEIVFGGDSELDTFFDALKFALNVLGEHTAGTESRTMSQRKVAFYLYINELCEMYRKNGTLKGMSEIRDKHGITGVTKQQFFEAGLDHAKGFVDSEFTDKLYEYVLDNSKSKKSPVYSD